MKRLLLLLVLGAFVMATRPSWADIPHLINYQGMLTDDAGNPLNEPRDLTFTIYDAPTNGTALWTETHTAVPIVDGLFNVILGGATTPVPHSVFDEPERYLGIKVATDPELSPRIQLTSVGYAYRAMTSGTAETDGDWNIDGNDMYSAVSGMVGIGTVTPPTTNTMLHVDATAHMDPTVGILVQGIYPWAGYFSGNVYADTIAIGTHDPEDKLHISGGNIRTDYYHGIDLLEQNGHTSMIWTANNDLLFCNFATGNMNFQTSNVLGTSLSRLFISNNGDIGIGKWNPSVKFDVIGNQIRLAESDTAGSKEIRLRTDGAAVDIDVNNANLFLKSNTGHTVIQAFSGNVGIGNTTPSYKLDVGGDINVSGNIRKGGTAYTHPDYVFEPDYTLLSLEDLKEYVSEKKCLPNVISAEEVKKNNGYNMDELLIQMLEKIEEQTLYIFQLEERIAALESKE